MRGENEKTENRGRKSEVVKGQRSEVGDQISEVRGKARESYNHNSKFNIKNSKLSSAAKNGGRR